MNSAEIAAMMGVPKEVVAVFVLDNKTDENDELLAAAIMIRLRLSFNCQLIILAGTEEKAVEKAADDIMHMLKKLALPPEKNKIGMEIELLEEREDENIGIVLFSLVG